MKFNASPGIRAALEHRPSPPLRLGKPTGPPRGGKNAQDATFRQQLFAQAVWDIAAQNGNKPFPPRFRLDAEGPVYFDQGCIDMAKDWLECGYSNAGWPTWLQIKPQAWAAGRPPVPEAP